MSKFKSFLSKFSLKEILKFLVGGGSAVVTDFLVYHLLLHFGIEIWIAKSVSYVAGAAVGFVINKLWTFESKSFQYSEIIKYIILYLASACANTLVNNAVLAVADVNIIAFLAATATSTVINFLGQKFFVFSKKSA